MDKFLPKPEAQKNGWKVNNSKHLVERKWFRVREDTLTLPSGNVLEYVYMEHPGAVLIVPVTPEKKVVLIHCYRYTLDKWCWEVPSGTLADRIGIPPEEVALSELRETGAETQKLEKLGAYYQGNGHASNLVYYFAAHDVTIDTEPELESGEVIDQISQFTFPEIKEMILDGRIDDGDSAFALLLAVLKLGE